MKRLILLTLTVCAGLALTACGQHTQKNAHKETPTTNVSSSSTVSPPPSVE